MHLVCQDEEGTISGQPIKEIILYAIVKHLERCPNICGLDIHNDSIIEVVSLCGFMMCRHKKGAQERLDALQSFSNPQADSCELHHQGEDSGYTKINVIDLFPMDNVTY